MFHLVCGIGTGLSRAEVQYVSILNTSWGFFQLFISELLVMRRTRAGG